ncbi:MAG: hypothetical protein QMC68_00165 [Bacteroidia bacterium]|jgi:hypothetical protein|nr:hypothetical protein [Bacteroidia bacterium]|tara:strand:- start:2984 stop:3580 length:597 start_codon:yes stop_codon:yes gene_type:complete
MKNIQFPINLKFNISTFRNDFVATDADARTIAYVSQKLFKLKEDITVYTDESKTEINYKIKADRWIDFSAAYSITQADGTELGKVARKGWRSLWKAKYLLIDQQQKEQFTIEEENGWVKVIDGLLCEIPLVGIFSGYFFNPTYGVTNLNGRKVARLSKQKSFFGRSFEIEKLEDLASDDDERVILGLMMMVLLERRRG